MITVFNDLIFNLLATRRRAIMPGLGYLYVELGEPEISSKQLGLPVSRIIFSDDVPQGESVVDILTGESGLERGDVEYAYNRWVSVVRPSTGGGNIFIEGVCSVERIEGGGFCVVPCDKLGELLNPGELKPISISKIKTSGKKTEDKKRGGKVAGWSITLFIIIACGVAAFVYRDNILQFLQPASTDSVPIERPDTTVVIHVTENTIDTTLNRDSVSTATVDIIARELVAQASGMPATVKFHLITGVFSTTENAQAYIDKNCEPALKCEIIATSQGKFMVSIGSFLDNDSAVAAKRNYSEKFPEAWIFKK